MATCYRCGKPVEGIRAIGSMFPICVECETLDTLKKIGETNANGDSSNSNAGGFSYSDVSHMIAMAAADRLDYLPKWIIDVDGDDRAFNAGMLCFFFGTVGAHLFYLKRHKWLAWMLVISLIVTSAGSLVLTLPFFMMWSFKYFMMDDMTFIKTYFPERFRNFFMAKLIIYNLVTYHAKPPAEPPERFVDCILDRKTILDMKEKGEDHENSLRCKYKFEKLFYDRNINGRCFPKEARIYNEIEKENTFTWQESFLSDSMKRFPELSNECQEAIDKIHNERLSELNKSLKKCNDRRRGTAFGTNL